VLLAERLGRPVPVEGLRLAARVVLLEAEQLRDQSGEQQGQAVPAVELQGVV
jgi:hypothetical protein